MLLDASVTQDVALGAAGGALLAPIVTLVLAFRLRRLRKTYRALLGDSEHDDLVGLLAEQRAEMQQIRGELAAVRGENGRLRTDVADAVRHVAVVRYDAFADMGGRLSFSAALLDDAGDGLVMTSINGRTETRTYAKGVKGCRSSSVLSPEEQKAIDVAYPGHPPVAAAPSPGRRGGTAEPSPTEHHVDDAEVESVTVRPAPARAPQPDARPLSRR